MQKISSVLLVFFLFLADCRPVPVFQPTAHDGNIPTSTTGLSPTVAASFTPMALDPSATPTPEPTLTPTATLEPTPRRGTFINIFCLYITQTIKGSTSPPNQPIAETLGRVLAGAGLLFITAADSCDAVLHLDLTFTPRGYDYQAQGSDQTLTCYTGAALRGAADLTWQGNTLYHRDLQVEYLPTGEEGECPEPEGAPFAYAWLNPSMEALIEIWGKNVLVSALSDPFRVVREAAAQSLPRIGVSEILAILPFLGSKLDDTSPVVRQNIAESLGRCSIDPAAAAILPGLINALQKEQEPDVTKAIVQALAAISGQDFGSDPSLWQQWWQNLPK